MRPTEYACKVITSWVLFLTAIASSLSIFVMLALLIETNQLVFMLLLMLVTYTSIILWQVFARMFNGFGF